MEKKIIKSIIEKEFMISSIINIYIYIYIFKITT